LRKVVQGEWLLILNGLLSIAFGVIAMAQPATGALAFVWMIGWFAVVFGCLYLALAFRLKHLSESLGQRSGVKGKAMVGEFDEHVHWRHFSRRGEGR
jgi:hypothetical protein